MERYTHRPEHGCFHREARPSPSLARCLSIFTFLLILLHASARPLFAASGVLEVTWEPTTSSEDCTLGGGIVAGNVDFRCIVTLNEGEFNPYVSYLRV